MKTYLLKTEQDIPISLDEAWDFFSSPDELAKITPKEMGLVVTSRHPAGTKMYEGMLITYKVSPLFGIKLNWMTEITFIHEKEYFVDEQRFGPYAMWHHEHHFKEIEGGVRMTDILNYALPYGPVGRLGNKLLVASQIDKIFKYRERAVIDLFGEIS